MYVCICMYACIYIHTYLHIGHKKLTPAVMYDFFFLRISTSILTPCCGDVRGRKKLTPAVKSRKALNE